MRNFYCSHCGQPIQAQEESAGMEVGCPTCHRSVRVPGPPRVAAPSASRTWLWIGLAVLLAVMLTAAQILMAAQPTAAGADSPEMASFLARTLSTLAIVGVPALLLAAVGVSLGLLTNPPVSRLTGLVFSILLLPLTVYVLFGDSLTGARQVQNLIRLVETKADAMPRDLARLFTRSSRPSSTPTRQEVSDAMAGIKADAEKAIANFNDDRILPAPDLQFPTIPEPANDADKLRVLMQSFFLDMAALQNDYQKDLNAVGIETLLAPERIQADAGFTQSAQMIADMRKIVQKYKARSNALINSMPERLDKTGFNASLKAWLLNGFNQGLTKSLPLLQENWNIEENLVEVMADILSHLKATWSQWSVQDDGQLIFEAQSDADKYNQLMKEMNFMIERQEEINQQSIKATREKMQQL